MHLTDNRILRLKSPSVSFTQSALKLSSFKVFWKAAPIFSVLLRQTSHIETQENFVFTLVIAERLTFRSINHER